MPALQTKAQLRRLRGSANRTAGGAKGKTKYVSYCPECPCPDVTHPETAPHVVVARAGMRVTCSRGHRWVVR